MAKSGNLGNIYVSVNARLTKLEASLKKAEAKARLSGKKMDQSLSLRGAKKSLMSFNSMLVATFAGIGLATVARFTKSVVGIGTEFEHSMLIVKGVTRSTGKQFQALTDLAKELGETTEWTAQQAAGGLKFLGMAGLGAERSLQALPGMLDLATAGAIELATAADIATNAMTAMQIPVEELGRVNDVFIATITRSNTNMEMMAESFKYAAPLAKAYGVSIEQLAAMIGTLGNAGIQGSMAGTQLAFAFQKTQKVFEKLGTSGAGKSFVDALRAAKEAGWGAAEMMKAFGMRGGRAALVLKDLIPMVEDLEQKLNNSEGEAKKLAETMRSSTKTAFIELKSAIEGIAIAAFTENTGGLNEAIRALTKSVRDAKPDLIKMAEIFLDMSEGIVRAASAFSRIYELSKTLKQGGTLQTWMEGAWDKRLRDLGTGGEIITGVGPGEGMMSERERRRLGLVNPDEESRKKRASYNSRAMLTDQWNVGFDPATPQYPEANNPLRMEFDDLPEIKKYTDTKLELLDKELESNIRTVPVLTDLWATFYDEQTQIASEASIRKAAVLEEYEKENNSAFNRMKELSERTAWAMQENFSNFFFSAMKGELTSLKDFATSIFDSILKAFSDMAGQMLAQGMFGKDFAGGGWLSALLGVGTAAVGAGAGTTTIRGGAGGGYGFDSGGHIGEQVRGIGMQSGKSYEFHPNETVIPDSSLGNAGRGANLNNKIDINIIAVDAASFADMTNRNPEAIITPIMQGISDGNMPLINAIRGVV